MMKFLANENFPFISFLKLRDAGYDIVSVSENFAGITDADIMQMAIEQNRIVLTFDRDYGELIFKHGYKPVAGVVYFRLFEYAPDEPATFLINMMSHIQLETYFTVVDVNAVRQRKIS